jgi:hypothetical protein
MPKGSFSIFHHGDKFFMLKSLIKNFPDRSAMPTLVFSSLADEILEAWLRANLAFANSAVERLLLKAIRFGQWPVLADSTLSNR